MTIMEKETKIWEYRISKEEFQALEKCNSETRYTYTVKRIIDAEVLWTIVDEEDHLVIQTDGNKKLLPVWSSKEYAQVFCVKGENNYKYSAITSEKGTRLPFRASAPCFNGQPTLSISAPTTDFIHSTPRQENVCLPTTNKIKKVSMPVIRIGKGESGSGLISVE